MLNKKVRGKCLELFVLQSVGCEQGRKDKLNSHLAYNQLMDDNIFGYIVQVFNINITIVYIDLYFNL